MVPCWLFWAVWATRFSWDGYSGKALNFGEGLKETRFYYIEFNKPVRGLKNIFVDRENL